MKIFFEPNRMSKPRSNRVCFDNICIMPGGNLEVDDSIKNHPDFKEYVKKGYISVYKNSESFPVKEEFSEDADPIASTKKEEPEEPKNTESPLDGITVPDAQKLIEAEQDFKTLENWMASDNRAGIKRAIGQKLKNLREGVIL